MARSLYHPPEMREAPPLDPHRETPPPAPRTILLINPFYPKDPHASFGKHVLTPTLALTSIAGSTPPGWSVRYWDENLLQGPPPADPFPAVVGISVHLTFARRAFLLADWFRSRGATVILGGLHVWSCPDECAPHADALVLGEGVQVWPTVLCDIAAGRLRPRYTGSYVRGDLGTYADEPSPRREILPAGAFLTSSSLIATRGCHNRCGFCYLSTEGLKMPYQMRAVDEVVDQFAQTWRAVRRVRRQQPRIASGLPARAVPGARPSGAHLERRGDARRDRRSDVSCGTWRGAAVSGVFVGFESLAAENLDDARKKTPRPEDYARRVELFHRNGIQVNGSFVFGFDHDGPDVFERTVEWIEANRLECATFHILTPYPGTPLFRQMQREGRLLHTDWDLYDTAHVVFQPRRMTPDDLYRGYAWAYSRVFSHRSIWRRRPARLSAVLPYLGMSYLYKKSNRLWPVLIRLGLTHAVWYPLVELSRRRHLRWRRRLAEPDRFPGGAVPVGGLS